MMKPVLTILLACLALNAAAKEMPFEENLTGEQSAGQKEARLKNLSDTRRAAISMRQANRLSVKNGKIERFVSDPQMLEIKHDAKTGSLFIVPLTRESASLFVMTDSGRTHSLVLTPSEKMNSQNLEIDENRAADFAAGGTEASLPAELAVQNIFRNLKKIVKEESSRVSYKKMIRGGLTATPNRKWSAGRYVLEHWLVTNTGSGNEPLEESRFWRKGVVSIAVDRAYLKPKEKADLWIVRQGDA